MKRVRDETVRRVGRRGGRGGKVARTARGEVVLVARHAVVRHADVVELRRLGEVDVVRAAVRAIGGDADRGDGRDGGERHGDVRLAERHRGGRGRVERGVRRAELVEGARPFAGVEIDREDDAIPARAARTVGEDIADAPELALPVLMRDARACGKMVVEFARCSVGSEKRLVAQRKAIGEHKTGWTRPGGWRPQVALRRHDARRERVEQALLQDDIQILILGTGDDNLLVAVVVDDQGRTLAAVVGANPVVLKVCSVERIGEVVVHELAGHVGHRAPVAVGNRVLARARGEVVLVDDFGVCRRDCTKRGKSYRNRRKPYGLTGCFLHHSHLLFLFQKDMCIDYIIFSSPCGSHRRITMYYFAQHHDRDKIKAAK